MGRKLGIAEGIKKVRNFAMRISPRAPPLVNPKTHLHKDRPAERCQ
jgi:hypothetical protein